MRYPPYVNAAKFWRIGCAVTVDVTLSGVFLVHECVTLLHASARQEQHLEVSCVAGVASARHIRVRVFHVSVVKIAM